MDEHLQDEKKDHDTSVLTDDDSMLDFKSPIRFPKPKLNKYINSNINEKKKAASKWKSTSKNDKEPKLKQQLGKIKNVQESKPSIESSFFKSKGSSCDKNSSTDAKLALVCPLCFKTFKDLNSRALHMKICAYKNNIPTKKLIDAIELQKRQEDERKSLGLPAAPIMQDKKKPASRRTSLHEESNLELALALSKSLQEAEELDIINENEGLSVIPNQFVLQANEPVCEGRLEKLGFTNSKPASFIKNKKRRNNKLTLLQTRSQEERNHILTERISEILMGDEPITQKQKAGSEDNRVPERETVLKSSLLQCLHNKDIKLWNKAKLTQHQKCFYVTNLSEFITPEVEEEEEAISEFTNTCNINDIKLSQYTRGSYNNEKGHETIHTDSSFKHETCEHCRNKQFSNTVIKNWSDALNDSSASDIIIFVGNNKHIWAHKLVFYVQCSNILLDVTPNDTLMFATIKEKICWTDTSYDIALAFLEFIYCGVIKKFLHILKDLTSFSCLRNLARKYKVIELFAFLERKEIEVKQENAKVHCKNNEEQISEQKKYPMIGSDNVENFICSSKDSKLNVCEELIVEKLGESITEKSEFVKPELIKDVSANSLMQENMNYLSDVRVSRYSNASPDLFDDVDETIKSQRVSTIKHMDEVKDTMYQEEDDDILLLDLVNKGTTETSNFSKADSMTLLNSPEDHIKKLLSSPEFSTPKRENRSRKIKLKSNLSLFIERFQRENERTDIGLDSADSMLLTSPKLCRNPFRMKQHDASDEYFTSNTNVIAGEKAKETRGTLSMFDCITNPEPDTDPYAGHDTSVCGKPQSLNDSVQSSEFNTEECTEVHSKNNSIIKSICDTGNESQIMALHSRSTDSLNEIAECSQNLRSIVSTRTLSATQCVENIDNISLNSDTDEDEISMYSKYKMKHENNSIVKYRNFLQNKILQSNTNSNTANDECTERKDTDNDTIVPLNTNKVSELEMNRIKEYDSPVYIINDKNNKLLISSRQSIPQNRKINNSSKIRYTRSESNLDLQAIRRSSFISPIKSDINRHNSLTLSTSISLSPESDCDVVGIQECGRNKCKKSISCAQKIDESDNIFENDIYLANVHIDNDDDDMDTLSLIKEVNESNKEIVSIMTPKKKGAVTVTNNSFTQFKNSEQNTLQKESIRKFHRKSMSETSLNFNRKEIETIKSKFSNNPNKTSCKCSCRKILGVNASPEIIRDSVTPPPNYNGMLTPELHAELKKYGLKMQKRKRAIKLLTYIYNELHPTIDSTKTNVDSEFAVISSEDDGPPEKKMNYECELPLTQENTPDMHLPEDIIDEEKIFDEPEFTSVTDNTPSIRDTFLKLLAVKKELHNQILAYEPLCINSLHSMLKAGGFKYKMNTLMDFLDEQCITFYFQDKSKQK